MHESALYYGRRFFEVYCPKETTTDFSIVDIGSQDVNGSLREVSPPSVKYKGLDFVEGKGVDIVITDPYNFPLEDASADILVSSSCFEHSEFFWLVFLEAMRVLKPGGIFYLNVPSNGFFHQWPVDCWRFYPDSGHALVSWGKRNGLSPVLLESFIGRHSEGSVSSGGKWNDFVAVFLKDSIYLDKYPTRMVDSLVEFSNGYSNNEKEILRYTARSPDSALMELQNEEIEKISATVIERDGQITDLKQAIVEYDGQIAELGHAVTERDGQIANLKQAIVEYDGQIAELGHAVTERDQRIKILLATLTETRRQIKFFEKALFFVLPSTKEINATEVVREKEIIKLNQMLEDRHEAFIKIWQLLQV